MFRLISALIILSISFSVYAERKYNLTTGEYEEVGGDDYSISRDDAWEADSYNRRSDSLTSDYDNDGTPNYIDPYDNDSFKDPATRDFDNDGKSNYLDPYDNNWLNP